MHKCPPIYVNWRDFCQCAANAMPMGSDPVLAIVLYDGNCSKLDWHWISGFVMDWQIGDELANW